MAKPNAKEKLIEDAADASGKSSEQVKFENSVKTGPGFTVVREQAVSVPQLKLTANSTVWIKINSSIRIIELSSETEVEVDGKKTKQKDRCPAVNVVDLTDGEIKQMLLDKIPQEAFESYGDELVGLCFEVTKCAKVQAGKNGYHPYTIYKIKDPTAE